jgi:hypothetical protein
LGFYSLGNLADVLVGEIGGVPLTQEMLFTMASLMAVPIVMVFHSLILMPKANRMLNIIAAIVYIVVLLATILATITACYVVLAGIELVCLVLIVWFAFKWPKHG